MAARKALVIIGGVVKQLPAGDTIEGSGGLQDYQHVEALTRTTSTLDTFVSKVSLTTPVLTGNYRLRWSAVVDNGGNLGDFRLRNTTNALTIGDTRVFKAGDAAVRADVGGIGIVAFTGAAKTFEIQFRAQSAGNSQGCSDAHIEIYKV